MSYIGDAIISLNTLTPAIGCDIIPWCTVIGCFKRRPLDDKGVDHHLKAKRVCVMTEGQ